MRSLQTWLASRPRYIHVTHCVVDLLGREIRVDVTAEREEIAFAEPEISANDQQSCSEFGCPRLESAYSGPLSDHNSQHTRMVFADRRSGCTRCFKKRFLGT